jgi:hypothetical protein
VPREFMLVTERPSTEEVVRDAASGMSPPMTARPVWSGGGLEVTAEGGDVVATVLRSSVLEVGSAAERVVGVPVTVPSFWTEAYVTDERPGARELLERIAETVNGCVVELRGNE